MPTLTKDWKALGGQLETGLKNLLNGLVDDTISDIDGPVREVANRLAVVTKQNRKDLVAENVDQLAVLLVTKKLRAHIASEDLLLSALALGMGALVDGAIAGLASLRVAG